MIKSLIQWLVVGTVALASNPEPSNTFKFGDGQPGNKVLKFNRNQTGANPVIQWTESANTLQFSNDGTNFSDIGSGSGSGGSGINILTNPGFESGIAQGWTNIGGAFLAVNSGANLLIGKGSATFQAFGSGQNMKTIQYSIPNGLIGGNCAAQILYKGGDNNLTMQVIDGSLNVITSQPIDAAVAPRNLSLTFPCPATGTLALRITGTGASALIALDQMFLGSNSLIALSQSQFMGSLLWPFSIGCDWDTTSLTYANYSPQAACTFPGGSQIQGQAQIPATKIPAIKFASLPPGHYVLNASGVFYNGNASSDCNYRIHDGTNAWNGTPSQINFAGVATGSPTISFEMDYTTTQNNVTLQFQAQSAGAANCHIFDDNSTNFYISVVRYPSTQDTAVRPDQVANSWSGSFVGPSCAWISTALTPAPPARPTPSTFCSLIEKTNTNFGSVAPLDNGTPGTNYPGIVFTPSRPGSYSVCMNPTIQVSTNVQVTIALVGTQNAVSTEIVRPNTGQGASWIARNPVCGIYRATSTLPVTLELKMYNNAGTAEFATNGEASPASALDIIVFQIDYALPAPLLVNSVVTSSAGVEAIHRISVAPTCSVDPCTITSQDGNWVDHVERVAAGEYIVHFKAGTFSAPPSCPTRVLHGGSHTLVGNIPTATDFYVEVENLSGANVDGGFESICMGPK